MSTSAAAAALDHLLAPIGRAMTPEFARELVALRAPAEIQDRIDELAHARPAARVPFDRP